MENPASDMIDTATDVATTEIDNAVDGVVDFISSWF